MAVGVLTIDEYARAIGHAVWLERRCFERFGAWARDTPEPAVKLFFAAASAHHGLHASLLERLVPSSRDHDPEQLIGPADRGWAAQVEGADTVDPEARLVAARDLARLVRESHDRTLAAMTPVAEHAARRILLLVIADHHADDAALADLG